MKKNFLYFLLITALSTFTFVACGGDDDDNPEPDPDPVETEDTKPPVISLTKPVEGQEYERGTGVITLEGEITDDVDLKSCTVSVSIKDTEETASLKSTEETEDFEDEETFDLSGKSFTFEGDYQAPFDVIPQNATLGDYILSVSAVDAANNDTTITVNIKIIDSPDEE